MKTIILIFFYLLLYNSAFSQQTIELKLNPKSESKYMQSLLENDKLFILTFEKLNLDNMYFVFYIFNLKNNTIENQIKINNSDIYSNPIVKIENDSIKILNTATFENDVSHYIISKNFDYQKRQTLIIKKYLEKYRLPLFSDIKNTILYINQKPVNFSLNFYQDNNSFYSFDNSYKDKQLQFSKLENSNIVYVKKYPFKDFKDYENDFRQYSKFRKNEIFYSYKDRIYITPALDLLPVNDEDFKVLIFNKTNGDLLKVQYNFKNDLMINCEKINTLSDTQFLKFDRNGNEPIQYGIDKTGNFCICKSRNIAPDFFIEKIINNNKFKIYIGKMSAKNTTAIIVKK